LCSTNKSTTKHQQELDRKSIPSFFSYRYWKGMLVDTLT
jgi:hypothetical protein